MSGESRVARLIGDGDVTGGGLPLPVAFTAVADYLLDHGEAGFHGLARVIKKSLSFKEERILSSGWRTWDDFARDILAQMCDANAVAEGDGVDGLMSYRMHSSFVPGQWHNVIPAANIGFSAWGHEARAKREADSALLLHVREGLARYPDADKDVREKLYLAAGELAGKLGMPDLPDGKRHQAKKAWIPPAVRPPRPSAEELARARYGYEGAPITIRVKNPFVNGKRLCPSCNIEKTPNGFAVYWESGHNNGYFLRGKCKTCEAAAKKEGDDGRPR